MCLICTATAQSVLSTHIESIPAFKFGEGSDLPYLTIREENMQITSFAYLHLSAFFLTNENLLMLTKAVGPQAFGKKHSSSLPSPFAWRQEPVKESETGNSRYLYFNAFSY